MARRITNTQERRAQIVEALAAVMARKGYDGATIADIGAQAGLAPGLVHYHFRHKQEVLLALLDHLSLKHRGKVAAALEGAGPEASRRLDAFIDVHLSLGKDADPTAMACWILLGAEALRQEALLSCLEGALGELIQTCRDILALGVEKQVFMCEPEAAAAGIVAAIQGYMQLGATARARIPKGSAANVVKQMAAGLTGRS